MKLEDVKSNLCDYDPRNPLHDEDMMTDAKSPADCYCDNCFYGRTGMAEEILRLMGKQNDKI